MLTRFCEEPAYWTPKYQYWYLGQKRATRLRQRLLTVTAGGSGFRRLEAWIARWSQRLPCFLWATLWVRAGLLIGG